MSTIVQVKHEQVALAGMADLTIRSLLDRQQFNDPLGEALALGISSAQWPLFGLLWPSGRHLAAHMALRPMVAGERVLEIGCGLALASLVCHRRGIDITASDCHPQAGAFLRENLRLNALLPLPYRHGQWGALQPAASALAMPHGLFDLVIGSDVLYERDEAGTLAAFIDGQLSAAAQVLIIDPERGNRPRFSRHMAQLGFSLQQTRLAPLAGVAADYKGRLLHYQRAGPGR